MKNNIQKQIPIDSKRKKMAKNINLLNTIVSFTKKPQYFAVGIVDIVNSTNITANLPLSDSGFYYSIFLNSIADIVKKSGGNVIKNIGDSLLFSFQEYQNSSDSKKLIKMLECGMGMIDAHNAINERLLYFDLPEINYRVSADYGCVLVADTKLSSSKDLFGSPVNTCSKINHKALPNTMVIGCNLHEQVKSNKKFHFEKINSCIILGNTKYGIYEVERRIN